MNLRLEFFKKENFEELCSWYADSSIEDKLGVLDEEWLEDVLTDTSNLQYGGFVDDEMVASVGLYSPELEFPFYVVAEIAVKPSWQRKGVATKILELLFADPELIDSDIWLAFVDADNIEAIKFFEVNGWKNEEGESEEENLIAYKKINPAVSTEPQS